MARPAAWLLGVLALAVPATGCGSQRDETTPARRAPTHAESTARPAGAGARAGAYESTLIAALDPVLGARARMRPALAAGTPAARARVALREFAPALDGAIDQLRVARPPPPRRADHASLLARLRAARAAVRSAIAAAANDRSNLDAALSRVRRLLEAIG
jgi:hypothetical protein